MKLTGQISIVKKVSYQERLLFTKHIATMIKAGIPIAEALDTMVEQTKSDYFRKILSMVLDDIKNGKNLAFSFGRHPKVFDQFYISLVEIGEASGTLEENLQFLAQQLSKDYSLRKKVQSALAYFSIVFAVTFIMGGFISFYILPKLIDFFESFEIELPFTTKVLIVFAQIMKNYGIFILAGIIIVIICLRFIITIPKIKYIWHTLLLRIPIAGVLISYSQLARFSRNLGTLIKSGVPVVKSLEITSDTLSNLRFKSDILKVSKSLTKGNNIGESIHKANFSEFPPLVWRMIAVGEKTGKLDESLLYLGDFYDDEVDDISKNLTTILEPVLLIVIGLVVGFVALSIISPIYQLTGSIRR